MKNIVSVLKKDSDPIIECIQKVKDNLDIVTSIIDLALMEVEMLSRASREKILDRALEPVKEEYNTGAGSSCIYQRHQAERV